MTRIPRHLLAATVLLGTAALGAPALAWNGGDDMMNRHGIRGPGMMGTEAMMGHRMSGDAMSGMCGGMMRGMQGGERPNEQWRRRPYAPERG